MYTVRSLLFPASYRDSVYLMQLSQMARQKSGARQVSAMMASPRNRELMIRSALWTRELDEAGADDLVVAIEAPEDMLDECERVIRAMLAEPVPRPAGISEGSPLPLTLAAALEQKPAARLAIISVAGDYARLEAAQALALGLDVLLYSDGISLEDERALKELARRKGRLLMGPDCGTAIVGGIPLGFANRIRRGLVGLVGSSGTGLQECGCLLDRCGLGISHAYGTGGRDLQDTIGGITTLAALHRLAADPETELIALIAKHPGPETRKALARAFASLGKPVVLRYLGVSEYSLEKKAGARIAGDSAELARLAARTLAPMLDVAALEETETSFPQNLGGRGFVRGVFSGGTLCFEAVEILERELGRRVRNNVGLMPEQTRGKLPARAGANNKAHSMAREHDCVDMGAPEFTIGRPHPLISTELKMERLLAELLDPDVSVILTDIVLGYGASKAQASLLVQAMDKAALDSGGESRKKMVIASVCGTEGDTPSRSSQLALLRQAGVLVAGNNTQAACWAARCAGSLPASIKTTQRGNDAYHQRRHRKFS